MFKSVKNYLRKRRNIIRREKMIRALLTCPKYTPDDIRFPECCNTSLLSEILLHYIDTGDYEVLGNSGHQ
jgi:hypothetical protein